MPIPSSAPARTGSVCHGIFLPDWDETYLYFTESKVTADFIVDCVRDFWLTVRGSFPQIKTLLLNLDNGPENHSWRTPFMARLTALADEFGLTLQLAYYPPYHSKYNPIERVWVSWSNIGTGICSIRAQPCSGLPQR